MREMNERTEVSRTPSPVFGEAAKDNTRGRVCSPKRDFKNKKSRPWKGRLFENW